MRLKVPKDAVLDAVAKPATVAPLEVKDVLEGTDSTKMQDDGFDE